MMKENQVFVFILKKMHKGNFRKGGVCKGKWVEIGHFIVLLM